VICGKLSVLIVFGPALSAGHSVEPCQHDVAVSVGEFQATAEMESKQFIKLCRDARLIDRRLTQTACDLTFTKVKTMVGISSFKLRYSLKLHVK